MNQQEKAKYIAERLGSAKGRQRLADAMIDPFKTQIGVTLPEGCIVIEFECDAVSGSIEGSAVYTWERGAGWGDPDDGCVRIKEERC
jgi:hypothetical protein